MTLPGFPDPSRRRGGGESTGDQPPSDAAGYVEHGHREHGHGTPRSGGAGSGGPGNLPASRSPAKITVSRVAVHRVGHFSRSTVRVIGDASRAGGASASGLTRLIWVNVVQTGADGMIAVALANTIFFSAATNQQRSNVALYLAITMAPFALVAPVVGPLLDRAQRGRRYALAGTMAGRAVLAWIMAANFHNLALYPAVFGFLVLSKAFNVLKGACVPRVLPDEMSLVSANARMSIFGLAGGAAFGGVAAAVAKLTGSSAWSLRLTTLVFLAAAVLALRLPKHVDSSQGEVQANVVQSAAGAGAGRTGRRSLGGGVVTALRGSGSLRLLSGFLTLFLAFLVQHEYDGFTAVLALGAVAAAAGVGSLLGTAAGARLQLGRPDVTVVRCLGAAAAMCLIAALAYTIEVAVVAALVAGVTNNLAKLSLDAIIQRDVPDWLRASAFGRSETLLQLAWVVGGALGTSLPLDARIGFGVATGVLAGALAFILIVNHKASRAGSAADTDGRPDAPAQSTAG